MKKILIFVFAFVSFTLNASPQPLSMTEVKTVYDFVNRVDNARKYGDECSDEIKKYNMEGESCVKFSMKIRILNGYYVRINRMDTFALNDLISTNDKLYNGFELYFNIVQIHSEIIKNLNF